MSDVDTPVTVTDTDTSPVVKTAQSSYTVCALGQNGDVRCWGRGTEGQLGDGEASDSSVPVYVIRP